MHSLRSLARLSQGCLSSCVYKSVAVEVRTQFEAAGVCPCQGRSGSVCRRPVLVGSVRYLSPPPPILARRGSPPSVSSMLSGSRPPAFSGPVVSSHL